MPFNTIVKYLIATLLMVVLIFLVKMGISQYWVRLIIVVPSGIFLYFGALILMKESLVIEIITKIRGRFIHV
jgi:hypothetical protein